MCTIKLDLDAVDGVNVSSCFFNLIVMLHMFFVWGGGGGRGGMKITALVHAGNCVYPKIVRKQL